MRRDWLMMDLLWISSIHPKPSCSRSEFLPSLFLYFKFVFPVRFLPRSYVHFYIYKSSTKSIDKRNNHQTTWTYNQSIILTGLSKLYKHTHEPSLLSSALSLVDVVICSTLVPEDNGILVEEGDSRGTCDQDQWVFKGIFFLYLGW